jgi:hypothetical protein
MNAPAQPYTTQDRTLQALVARGLAQAQAREAANRPQRSAPPARPAAPRHPRALGLGSDRACVETNLARKGLWRCGSSRDAGGGELVPLLDATDQLGLVQRIDAGPPLGALAFEVIVWVCSHWRERGEGGERRVPFTLEAMASDLGWRKGGGAAGELARSLDALRLATFRARVHNARLAETRIDTFGLLDRWERGEPDRQGCPARSGFLVLGDWLHEQVRSKHVTFVSWAELRALRSGTARRLLVYLEAERFVGRRWRRSIDAPLLTTLGVTAVKPFHQRATLRRAAAEVTRATNRYERAVLEPADERGAPWSRPQWAAHRRRARDPPAQSSRSTAAARASGRGIAALHVHAPRSILTGIRVAAEPGRGDNLTTT